MRSAAAPLLLLAFTLAGCSLAGNLTPPAALATAQAAETQPPATVAVTRTLEAAAVPSMETPSSSEIGAVRGVVTNGTPGGTLPDGLEAILSGFDGEEETYQQSVSVAADGTYSFSDIPTVPGRIYDVSVAYDDVLYFSEGAHLTGGEAPLDLPVTVFDTTTDPAELGVERLHVLFDFSMAEQVQVIELWVLSNSGDRTIVAEAERGVIEVSLPEGALDLAFEDGSSEDRYVQTANGFGDTNPVIPGTGTSQFIFSYWLPYHGSLAFRRPSGHPINAAVVLLPQSGVAAEGPGLQDLGLQEIGGQVVRTYESGAIPAGQVLEVELSGEPERVVSGAGAARTTAIGLGVLAGLLIVTGVWWFWPIIRPSRGQAETGALVDAIAELDDALDAGRIQAAEHRQRREALKQKLRERMG